MSVFPTHPFFTPLLEKAPFGVVAWHLANEGDDESMELVFANPAAERFVHQKFRARLGARLTDIFPNTDRARLKMYADVARTGVPWNGVIQGRAATATETFSMQVYPAESRLVIVLFENLTTEREARAEVQRLNLFLDSLIENLPFMLFVKRASDLCFERINRAGEALLGLDRSALLGKSDYDFFPKAQADAFVLADRKTLEEKDVVDIPEEPINTANGLRWLHTKKVTVRDAEQRPMYLLGISEDITEEREAVAALSAAKERAEVSNRELEAFSYSVAHDLRTPLRAIHGFSEALTSDFSERLNEEGLDYLARIRRAAFRMGVLIDDLLKLARISRTEIRRERVDVTALAREIIAEPQYAARMQDTNVKIQDGLVANADARFTHIVLDNLLGNAFKFTEKTTPSRIELGEVKKDGKSFFFVRDNGVGFDMAHASRLFSAFERLHAASSFEGSGIGLAIVQRIALRHGGSVWAESEPNRGATFYFTLDSA